MAPAKQEDRTSLIILMGSSDSSTLQFIGFIGSVLRGAKQVAGIEGARAHLVICGPGFPMPCPQDDITAVVPEIVDDTISPKDAKARQFSICH